MTEKDSCETCRFAVPGRDVLAECHKRAAVASVSLHHRWAPVEAHEWCGEHEPRGATRQSFAEIYRKAEPDIAKRVDELCESGNRMFENATAFKMETANRLSHLEVAINNQKIEINGLSSEIDRMKGLAEHEPKAQDIPPEKLTEPCPVGEKGNHTFVPAGAPVAHCSLCGAR